MIRPISATASGPASTAWVAPSSRARSSFSGTTSTATIVPAPASTAPSRAERPTPPSPKTATRSPSAIRAAFDGGPDPGQHGAAEERRELERQLGVDLHRGALGDDDPLRERGDAEVVVERLAVELAEPPLAAEERPGRVGRRARLAERRAARPARLAMPACGNEGEHHVVAGRELVDALADRLDLARGLVAERHRHHPRPRAIDHREVGVAEPGGADPDQELAGSRRVELDLDHLERARLGVGGRGAHLPQDRRTRPHPAHHEALEALTKRRRNRRRAARLRVHEDVHEPALGRRFVGAGGEQADLVADARAAELADPQARLDVVGEGEPRPIGAMGLGADADHVAAVDIEPALRDQPAVDHGVEEGVVLDVVDVAVDVVVVPARRDRQRVRVLGPRHPVTPRLACLPVHTRPGGCDAAIASSPGSTSAITHSVSRSGGTSG